MTALHSAKIIDGLEMAKQVRGEWRSRVTALREKGTIPGLAVIVAGDNSASKVYVRNTWVIGMSNRFQLRPPFRVQS